MKERLKLRVFISSVQKELASERLALQTLLTTDPFLQQHTIPVLYEREIHDIKPNDKAYLAVLDGCQVYVLILAKEYGDLVGYLSATHHEYRRALEHRLPTLICILGDSKLKREDALKEFLKEIKADNHTYSRFQSIEELQKICRDRLVKHIRENYHLEPTREEENMGLQTIQLASHFERQRLPEPNMNDLNVGLIRALVSCQA